MVELALLVASPGTLYRLPGPPEAAASGGTLYRPVEPGPGVGVWPGVIPAALRRRSSSVDCEGLAGREDPREIGGAGYANPAGVGDVG